MSACITPKGADISSCGRYRYRLWRRWGYGGFVLFIGLNPSTADASVDDPTIRRCVDFAQAWGFGGVMMVNLFAWRATDPRDMMAAKDPVGPDNNAALIHAYLTTEMAIAAWGTRGAFLGRDAAVRDLLPDLHCLRLTRDGHPGHPLHLPRELRPMPWSAGG
jgi:hypothetical protein